MVTADEYLLGDTGHDHSVSVNRPCGDEVLDRRGNILTVERTNVRFRSDRVPTFACQPLPGESGDVVGGRFDVPQPPRQTVRRCRHDDGFECLLGNSHVLACRESRLGDRQEVRARFGQFRCGAEPPQRGPQLLAVVYELEDRRPVVRVREPTTLPVLDDTRERVQPVQQTAQWPRVAPPRCVEEPRCRIAAVSPDRARRSASSAAVCGGRSPRAPRTSREASDGSRRTRSPMSTRQEHRTVARGQSPVSWPPPRARGRFARRREWPTPRRACGTSRRIQRARAASVLPTRRTSGTGRCRRRSNARCDRVRCSGGGEAGMRETRRAEPGSSVRIREMRQIPSLAIAPCLWRPHPRSCTSRSSGGSAFRATQAHRRCSRRRLATLPPRRSNSGNRCPPRSEHRPR